MPQAAMSQTAPPAGIPAPIASNGGDIGLDAGASFESLRFDTIPATRVRASGGPAGVVRVERRNVPEHPRAGRTYTHGRINLHVEAAVVAPARR